MRPRNPKIKGWTLDRVHAATTGSRYYYMRRLSDDVVVVIRESDHGECYPPEHGVRQIDVSPAGLSWSAALNKLRAGDIPAPYEPVADPAEREKVIQARRAEKDRARRTKQNALNLAHRISDEDWTWWNSGQKSRPRAAELAKKYDVGSGRMWNALKRENVARRNND